MQDPTFDTGDDDFQDAVETQSVVYAMDLDSSIKEAKLAVDLFFNNKFDEARRTLEPLANVSLYHALGNSVFKFLEAVLTFEQQHIGEASDALKQGIAVSLHYRKKSSISESLGKMVKGTNYDSFTPEEVHAELCYAELLLLKAILTFIEDETLVSFIKAGFKIKSCFSSYKECSNILNHRNWTTECRKVHFESGVRMGVGAFNLMISLLPTRVIKLLEFIGFSGNKDVGLHELSIGYRLQESLRQVLSVMTLLGYHLFVVYFLSHSDGDLDFCDEIINNQLQIYPQGAWFLFCKGRLEFVKGNVSEAIHWYTKSWKSQDIWPQFHHLCFWELMFTNGINEDWREAASFAEKLVQESRWSKTIYSYQKAVMLYTLGDGLLESEKKEIDFLMKNAPSWKQRIAGKSLPMEKFVIKRTERYFAQQNSLVLPAYEVLYVWNFFKIIGKQWCLIESVFRSVERAYKSLKNAAPNSSFYGDNLALALLLKGACLRQMKSPLQAEECLKAAIALKNVIQVDEFLVPYAKVELALLYNDEKDYEKASHLLEDAKKNHTGYSLESRLHFKIHSAQMDLQETKKRDKSEDAR